MFHTIVGPVPPAYPIKLQPVVRPIRFWTRAPFDEGWTPRRTARRARFAAGRRIVVAGLQKGED
jgi:hypothetical protein